jgi:putative membrane protein insertion efficiency factor
MGLPTPIPPTAPLHGAGLPPVAGKLGAIRRFLVSLPQHILITLVRGYRLFLSPWLGSACRFEPSCSAYSLQALQTHGAALGSYLTLRRLARCHPFCEGGHDPVPERALPGLFRHFVTGAPRAAGTPPSPSIDKTSP